MRTHRLLALLPALALLLPPEASATTPTHARHHAKRHRPAHHRTGGQVPAPYGYGYGYGPAPSATPDCRYPDGTPFDPDIIGGQNHVGDGGPAVNLGGFPPCGY